MKPNWTVAVLMAALLSLSASMGVQAQDVDEPDIQPNGVIENEGTARKLLSREEMQAFTTGIQEAESKEEKHEIQENFRDMVRERAKTRGIDMRSEKSKGRNAVEGDKRGGKSGGKGGKGSGGGRGSGGGSGGGRR